MNVSTSSTTEVVSNRVCPLPVISLAGASSWFWLLALLWVLPVHAETVKLVATQNAQIDSDAPNTPFEEWGILDANSSRRILIQFDLSAIPPGASITSARLGLVSRAPFNYAYGVVMQVWRVENDAWNQFTVTWNNFVSGSTDYLAVLGGGVGQHYSVWDIDLNAWNKTADLADNKFSVLVLSPDSGMSYYSRAVPNPNNGSGSPDADIVPYLEITYAGNPPVIAPPLIRVLSQTNNQLALAWNTFPGWSYQLQSNLELAATNWITCSGTNYASELNMTNTVAAGPGQKFFRVQQVAR
jgi:hypothetical protein